MENKNAKKSDKLAVVFPDQLKKLICMTHLAGLNAAPIYIEGSPGLGKSKIPEQAAKELGVAFQVIHAPLMQPEDYSFPMPNAEKTSIDFLVSKTKFPVVGSKFPEKGIFLADEVGQCDPPTQKILAGMFYDRNINGVPLLPGWTIIGTGNRVQDRAGASRLLTHLRDRVIPLELNVKLNDWTNWAIKNLVPLEVVLFIRFRPDLLNTFDPQLEFNATPRAWSTKVAKYFGKLEADLELPVYAACVGEGPATEFLAFVRDWKEIPNPDSILLNPTTASLPSKVSICYATIGALVQRVTPVNFGRALKYVQRIGKETEFGTEFEVVFIRDAFAKDPNLSNCADAIDWMSNGGAELLT